VMSRAPAKALSDYHRRVHDRFERIRRDAAAAREVAAAKTRRAKQEAKYAAGAASSPTPAPARSRTRDEIILKILTYSELDCSHVEAEQLVTRLAESVLHEQGVHPSAPLLWKHKSTDDLHNEVESALEAGREKQARRILSRVEFRSKLTSDAAKTGVIRPYGWDKTTPVLRSVFYAFAMDAKTTRPFTLAMTRDAVGSAKEVKHGFASGLQERLKRLLARRLPGEQSPFWFRVELGGSGDFHLHGAVIWPNDPEWQRRVAACLLKLAGASAPTQLDIAEGAQAGWAAYCQKHSLLTRDLLRGNTLVATLDVKQRAKELYGVFYARLNELL
jgi:hypothetical protein